MTVVIGVAVAVAVTILYIVYCMVARHSKVVVDLLAICFALSLFTVISLFGFQLFGLDFWILAGSRSSFGCDRRSLVGPLSALGCVWLAL